MPGTAIKDLGSDFQQLARSTIAKDEDETINPTLAVHNLHAVERAKPAASHASYHTNSITPNLDDSIIRNRITSLRDSNQKQAFTMLQLWFAYSRI